MAVAWWLAPGIPHRRVRPAGPISRRPASDGPAVRGRPPDCPFTRTARSAPNGPSPTSRRAGRIDVGHVGGPRAVAGGVDRDHLDAEVLGQVADGPVGARAASPQLGHQPEHRDRALGVERASARSAAAIDVGPAL